MRYLTNEPEEKDKKLFEGDSEKRKDNVEDEDDTEKGKYIIRRPFEFEGRKMTELDISALDEIRGRDLDKVREILRAKGVNEQEGYFNAEFCFTLLSVKSGIPLELFGSMYSVDYIILQKVIERFLLRLG